MHIIEYFDIYECNTEWHYAEYLQNTYRIYEHLQNEREKNLKASMKLIFFVYLDWEKYIKMACKPSHWYNKVWIEIQ